MDAGEGHSHGITQAQILDFLKRLGERHPQPATLYLLGGSALVLLGSPRPTLDIDYLGSDVAAESSPLQTAIREVSRELHVPVEAVPLDEFIPLPPNATERHLTVGQFGALRVLILDPYTIALSKVERGFESDLEDVVFMLRRGVIERQRLEEFVMGSLEQAREFDLDPHQIRVHLAAVRQLSQQ